MTNTRLHTIDALRGLTVLSMVLYHFLYDVMMIYGLDPGWTGRSAVHVWQQSICWTFILISGFVWPWGRAKNLQRGLWINLWGLVITAVTCLVTPSEAIWFGILSFMGCAVLLMLPLEGFLRKLHPVAGLVLFFGLFCLFRHVTWGWLGIGMTPLVELPDALYSSVLGVPFGFPYPGFRSSDYFPLLPWFFLYVCGYYGNRLLALRPGWAGKLTAKVPGLDWIGRHALAVYVVHQPLCMGLCMILFG